MRHDDWPTTWVTVLRTSACPSHETIGCLDLMHVSKSFRHNFDLGPGAYSILGYLRGHSCLNLYQHLP